MAALNVSTLFYGDNLEILRKHVADECVDLIYLDPPFNSNRSYNVLFKSKSGDSAQAQIEAFGDTWTWSQQAEEQYVELVRDAPQRVADAMTSMRGLVGDNDVLAYLVMMTARLLELRRVLKSSGSLYLHCDPTASHYLKIMLDAIFGPENYRSEIIWKRTGAHSDSKQGRKIHGHIHDVILFYTKSNAWTWNPVFTSYDESYINSHYRYTEENTGRRFRKDNLTAAKPGGDTLYEWRGVRPYSGRFWAYSREKMEQFEADGRLIYTRTGMPELKRYLDEMPGVPPQDLWTDIDPINARAAERLGYPTQKPLALLERIIATSSNPGDLVLDPFCGCGTTVDAAQKLGRRWVGIDITFLAIDLIENRLRSTHGEAVKTSYVVHGIPHDRAGAQALMRENAFDFERWAVAMVDGQPHERHEQVGDKGVDGTIRFPISNDYKTVGKALVSVKGGSTVNPGMVRDLVGTVQQQRADMGIFICMTPPTPGMKDVAQKSGSYEWPITGKRYARIQIITIDELLAGRRPDMPTPFIPYQQAKRLVDKNQLALDL